jgi:hypothetical protein
VPAQLFLQVVADRPGADEPDQAAGEALFLRPGGQPDRQPPGGDMINDGALAVRYCDSVVDQALVERQIGKRPAQRRR